MKTTYLILLWLATAGLMLLLNSCEVLEDIPCERGDGARVTETRDIVNFRQILVDMPGDVYITQGSEYSFSITAQENMLAKISTEVNGEMLTIANDKCLGNHKTIRVEITLPELTEVQVNGSGDVYGQGVFTSDALRLQVDGSGGIEWQSVSGKVTVDMDGSGNITLDTQAGIIDSKLDGSGDLTLKGSADEHYLEVESSGNVHAYELTALQCNVLIDGRGDAQVMVQDSLRVNIKGSGSVFYKGNPSISVDISGSGNLTSAN